LTARLALAGVLLLAQAALLVLALFFPDPPAAFRDRYLSKGADVVEPVAAKR